MRSTFISVTAAQRLDVQRTMVSQMFLQKFSNVLKEKTNVLEFRKNVNEKLLSFIKENLPSLAESDKSLPPNDWIN